MWKNRIAMGIWLLAAAILCFFENNPGTWAVLAGSVVLPAFSAGCALWTAARLQVELEAPSECREQQECRVSCRFRQPWTGWFCQTAGRIIAANRTNGETQTARITPDHPVFVPDTRYCGAIRLTVSGIVVTDWFGLVRREAVSACCAEVMVAPTLFPVQLSFTRPVQAADVTSRQPGGAGDETLGVRTYAPGDPIRMIHWKLSEKLGQTMVRETGRPAEAQLLLLLDPHRTPDAGATDVHACIRAFLSAARAMTAAELCFQVCIMDQDQGMPVLLEIDGQDALDRLCGQVLTMAISEENEPIGPAAARNVLYCQPRRTVLFSTGADTDAASLYLGEQLLLVIPHTAGQQGTPEIALCALNEETPYLDL